MSLSSGSVLGGRYRLAELLGEGGVGEVWSATHLLTGRAVAIKRLIASRHGSAPTEARARFMIEAQSACAVSHPNVVQVLDFADQPDEAPFLVMELLRGETLSARLARAGALSLEETARLLLPMVSAVGTAHARGIVHRDLKPSNIFLSSVHGDRPEVKVLDFGIAKWLAVRDERSDLRTQTGSTLGTPSYMSPEQATAERGVDHRADIWSIGVILYECLSGARPIEGENAAQMVMRLLSSGIIPIEHLVPDLPPRLSELIGSMLSRDPARRPQTLAPVFEVLADLSGASAPHFGEPNTPRPSDHEALAASVPLPLAAKHAAPELTGAPSTLTPSDFRGSASAPALSPQKKMRWGWLRTAAVLAGVASLGLLLGRALDRAPPVASPHPTRLAAAPSAAAPLVPPVSPPVAASTLSQTPAAQKPAAQKANALPPSSSDVAPLPRNSERLRASPASKVVLPRPLPSKAEPTSAKGSILPKSTASESQGLPSGSECDRSSDCQSRLCLAFSCE